MNRSITSYRTMRLPLLLTAVVISTAASGQAATTPTTTTKAATTPSKATTAPAKATKSCGKQVVADWYDNGRVDRIYALECYRKAIDSLPPDVVDYSNAKEQIGRALAFARQGKPDPGGSDPTPVTPTGTTQTGTGKTSTGKTSTGKTSTGTGTTATGSTSTVPRTDTAGPSSIPIPLIVLGGLALLLLAAGSAGYLRRRLSGDADDSA